jgi:DNA-binding transcriptional ArsR family regulator
VDWGKKRERQSSFRVLSRIASSARLFRSADGRFCAQVPLGERREIFGLRSPGFRDWLIDGYFAEQAEPPSSWAIRRVIGLLEARARFTLRHCHQGRMPALDKFRRLANYRIMSQVFKALSDPTRRRVLQLLRKGPMSAGELSDQFDVSKPTMSAHFAVLKEADLVHAEKVGKSVIYHLKLSVLEEALLGFAHSFGIGAQTPVPKKETAR